MKKQSASLILMLFAFLFSLVEVQAEEINKSFIGEWVYKVSDAPYEYEKGSLVFSEIEGETVCVIKLAVGELAVSNIKIALDTITFTTYVEGSAINAKLIRKNDQLTGKVDSPEGPKILTAVRKRIK